MGGSSVDGPYALRSRRAGSAGATSTAPWTRWIEGVEESLWLIAIGVSCLVLAYVFLTTRAIAGSSRFPLWELLLALGVVALVGGLVASFVREPGPRPAARKPEAPVARLRRGRAPPRIWAVGRIPTSFAPPRRSPPALPEEPSRPPRERSDVQDSLRIPRAAPPAEAPTAGETIEELDRLVDDLIDRREDRAAAWSEVRERDAFPSRSVARPGAGRRRPTCGSCGRAVVPSEALVCGGCGTPLCDSCFRGLAPPPCPSCADLRV